MKILLQQMGPTGLVLDHAYDPKALDVNREDLAFRDVHLSGEAHQEGDHLTVHAVIDGIFESTCARCLEPIEQSLRRETALYYPIKQEQIIDVTEDVRTELLLDLPIAFLCRPDCRGLCVTCGRNLNEGPCEHHEEQA